MGTTNGREPQIERGLIEPGSGGIFIASRARGEGLGRRLALKARTKRGAKPNVYLEIEPPVPQRPRFCRAYSAERVFYAT